jgi:sec-independent protein translocase protein TatB
VHRIAAFALPLYDVAMSFSDTVFLFFLALILFGPKKLPEMARQAGRLLAELRRASNEFKSQIETEIAHLEVEKNEVEKRAQEILPPSPPPQGTVASLSSNPTPSEPVPQQLEAPVTTEPVTEASPSVPASSPGSTVSTETVADPHASASQESHV